NLLETTVAVFTTAASAAAIEAALAEGTVSSFGWGIVSGGSIAGAALTKGPVGLFPLAAPVIFSAMSGTRRAWAGLAGQWATVAVFAAALWSVDVSRSSLTQYAHEQVLAALGGQRETSGD